MGEFAVMVEEKGEKLNSRLLPPAFDKFPEIVYNSLT